MKRLLVITALFVLAYPLAARCQTLQQNNQWLEKQLNQLTKEKKDDPALFHFQECQAKMEIKTKEEGLNFGMSLASNWKDLKNVSYHKKGSQYELTFDVLNKEKEVDDFSFSLNTTDEKLMKEIKSRIEQNQRHCLARK